MQFICETCKANLQIADEKVRGKRLLVRCKRCGAQIRIADPALVPSQSAVRPATGPIRTSQSGTRPATGPVARPRPAARVRDTDTESTRAMDSDVLEQALLASKGDEAATAALAQATSRAARPSAAAYEPAPPRGPAIWFAVIAGKQTGPISSAELAAKAAAGQVGPRTYLWKEGMESWVRAKDVAELSTVLPPPAPPPERRDAHPGTKERAVELPFDPRKVTPRSVDPAPAGAATPVSDGSDVHAQPGGSFNGEPAPDPRGALDLARWGAGELARPRVNTPAGGQPEVAAPAVPQRPAPEFRLGQSEARNPLRTALVMFGIAVVIALLAFMLLFDRKGSQPPVEAASAPPSAPEQRTPEQRSAEAQPGDPAASAAGLSPEVVKRKVDESKPALQGCIDEALKREPALHVGRILITTTIAPSGAVASARIDRKAVDQSPLGACLKAATRRIQFPSFPGDAFAVDIPIVVTGGE